MASNQAYGVTSGQWAAKGRPPVGTVTKPKLRIRKINASGIPGIVTPPPTGFDRETLVYGTYNPKETGYYGPNPGIAMTVVGTPSTSTSPGTDTAVNATKDGDIIENKIIYGYVNLLGFKNVTVRNCIIYGAVARGVQNIGHIRANNNNYRNARIVDCELGARPGWNNEWAWPIIGGGFAMERCEIYGTSDGIGLNKAIYDAPQNFIAGNYIHDCWWNEWPTALGSNSASSNSYKGPPLLPSDFDAYNPPIALPTGYFPYSVGTANYTHVDGIQFFITHDVVIRGNYIGGHHAVGQHNVTPSQKPTIQTGHDYNNSCILVKQEGSSNVGDKITNVVIENNWFYGAQCSLNLAYANGNAFESVTIQNNSFLQADWSPGYYVLRDSLGGVPIVSVFANNRIVDPVTYIDAGPVPVTRGAIF